MPGFIGLTKHAMSHTRQFFIIFSASICISYFHLTVWVYPYSQERTLPGHPSTDTSAIQHQIQCTQIVISTRHSPAEWPLRNEWCSLQLLKKSCYDFLSRRARKTKINISSVGKLLKSIYWWDEDVNGCFVVIYPSPWAEVSLDNPALLWFQFYSWSRRSG